MNKNLTKEAYEEFRKGYKANGGILDEDRAFMYHATGDRGYLMRRDLYPGISVNNLPSEKDIKNMQNGG